MLFNSFVFALFLPIVLTLYWGLQRKQIAWQNGFLLLISYIFYGWWDYRFLSLIFISSLVDYFTGLRLGREERPKQRKILLLISLTVNLGLLGFFKYYGFFVESFAEMISWFGFKPNISSLRVILPVGISFYTFQTLSYSIDIYRRKLEPTRDAISFFAFVSFFPQLVAGPIERAKNLLPQFFARRRFEMDNVKDGMRQMLWGFLKKTVIADNIAVHVDAIYNNHTAHDGFTLFIATFFFAIQIYCDFSGYSDIAIGVARLFGFKLMRNFAYPYFSRDIGEFWRRWHISLSSWFRDYVYIPLGGSRVEKPRRIWNIIVTFTVSGFWHGANWNFLAWGFINGAYYIPLMLADKQKKNTDTVAEGRLFPSLAEAGAMSLTFLMALFAWIFFRAESITVAFEIIGKIVTHPFDGGSYFRYIPAILYCYALLLAEWFQRTKQHALQIESLPVWVRWSIYYAIIFIITIFAYTAEKEFIYFQF